MFSLWLAGETWNVSSIVGMIGLFGVAVQNSLVLISRRRTSTLFTLLVLPGFYEWMGRRRGLGHARR